MAHSARAHDQRLCDIGSFAITGEAVDFLRLQQAQLDAGVLNYRVLRIELAERVHLLAPDHIAMAGMDPEKDVRIVVAGEGAQTAAMGCVHSY